MEFSEYFPIWDKLSGGIGGGAQAALAAANIRLYGGVSGGADEAVEALLRGELRSLSAPFPPGIYP